MEPCKYNVEVAWMKMGFRIVNASKLAELQPKELLDEIRKGLDVTYNADDDEMVLLFKSQSGGGAGWRFVPSVFNPKSLQDAKEIILTEENGVKTDVRWEKETPVLMRELRRMFGRYGKGRTVVDYGCGIGRLSKGLCSSGYNVVGVDMSEQMRAMAVEYVNSRRFSVVSPEEFEGMVATGFRCDIAIAVWVLQHCLEPEKTFNLIRESMKSDGLFFIMNNSKSRALPSIVNGAFKWFDDGKDIFGIVEKSMEKEKDVEIATKDIGLVRGFYKAMLYRKP